MADDPNGLVDYSVTCSECGTQAWFTTNLYTEAKAKASALGWGFHGMKKLYADIGHGQRRQHAELGTVLCPIHQEIFEENQRLEAEARAKKMAEEEERRMAERPSKWNELAEHLRAADELQQELGWDSVGVNLDELAYYADRQASWERGE